MMAMALLFLGIYLYETKKSQQSQQQQSATNQPDRKETMRLSATMFRSTAHQMAEKVRRNTGTR
jgi:hypothetical protein